MLRKLVFIGFLLPAVAVGQVRVATAPPLTDKALSYRDSHYGVRFQVRLGGRLLVKIIKSVRFGWMRGRLTRERR